MKEEYKVINNEILSIYIHVYLYMCVYTYTCMFSHISLKNEDYCKDIYMYDFITYCKH